MIQLDMLNEELCDIGIYYAFRDKKTQRYIGYDGYDTDFAKGLSPIIEEYEITIEFNKRLFTKTHPEIVEMLTNEPMGSKAWNQLGGIAKIEIVRLEISVEGQVFTPSALLNLISSEDTDIDYEEMETSG